MRSELSNLYLFAFAIAKAGALTGLFPAAIFAAIFVRCPFPFCVLREFHADDHDVEVPIERFTPFREQAELFKSSGAGQLATKRILIPVNRNPATSPARKARRYA